MRNFSAWAGALAAPEAAQPPESSTRMARATPVIVLGEGADGTAPLYGARAAPRNARGSAVRSARERQRAHRRDHGLLLALHDAHAAIGRQGREGLGHARHRPGDLEPLDSRGRPEADVELERARPEAAVLSDDLEHGASAAALHDLGPYARADGGACRAPALELQLEPVVLRARVLEQRVAEGVAGEGPAHVGEHVLVAVLVEIRERDGVPLLQVAEAARGRDVGEAPPATVPVHHVRDEAVVERVARAEVHVRVAVVVEVAVARAHDEREEVEAVLHRRFAGVSACYSL